MRTDEATSLLTFEIEGPGYPGGYYTRPRNGCEQSTPHGGSRWRFMTSAPLEVTVRLKRSERRRSLRR